MFDFQDLSDNAIVKLCNKFLNVSSNYDGDKFFTIDNGVKLATPLLLTLAVIELSDVVFAVDSIPAVFGVTLDPFIVYTSNLFAILSLRALYGKHVVQNRNKNDVQMSWLLDIATACGTSQVITDIQQI